MDAQCLDQFVDENYDCLPLDDPNIDAYIQAVEKYENAIGKLREALPGDTIQDAIKVFSEISLLEIRMAFRQGIRAGIALFKQEAR